jgi:uncharacterized iron-regulated membrane protein
MIVGAVGITFIASVVSGVCLWWPLWLHSVRAAFTIRRGRLFTFDLHKTIGIASGAVLAIVAFTGVYMEFPDWFRNVAGILLPISDNPAETKSTMRTASNAISADQAISIAESLFPHARWDHMHPPVGVDGVFEVALRQLDEVQRSYGRTQVYIDRYSGEVTAVVNPAQGTVADAFFAAQFPFHNGEAFGLLGRLAVLLSGLSPAVLYVTGLVLWWRKRKSKKQLK